LVSEISGRLVLGTAQIGMRYGISNKTGKPDPASADRLLDTAWKAGMRYLDTAQNYGDSESIIGEWHRKNPDQRFSVVTKIDPSLDPADSEVLRQALDGSAARLGVRPAAILLHDPALATELNGRVRASLEAAQNAGEAGAIGLSVYTPAEFSAAISSPLIDIIQAPLNVFDTRILDEGLLDRAISCGKRVFIRSVFLQGFLTLRPDTLPDKMLFAANSLKEWNDVCQALGRDAFPTALKFVQQLTTDANLVIGCETVDQLTANLAAFDEPDLSETDIAAIATMAPAPERLINPALWP
jgi:aryl-alcohol dehydrogenase-like predicted oxidoreductase